MDKKINTITPWAKTIEEIYGDFQTGVNGLIDQDIIDRQKQFGPNVLSKRRGANAFTIFLEQFKSPLIFMLIGATIITALLREWIDMSVIIMAILVNVGLGFYQEYKANNTLEKLATYIKDRTRVFRNGHEREIDASELVPGDIIRLSLGMRIPADARLVAVNNFSVDEAILTGESLPVYKKTEIYSEGAQPVDQKNMVFAGTLIVDGNATAVVTTTGDMTQLGVIAKLVGKKKTEITPLQSALKNVAWIIFAFVVVLVTALFFLGISRGESVLQMLLLSAAVAVGAIPEALPIALTVILSAGVSRIAKKRGIMRSLSAAETLGSTTLVMTDKTGTLTQAKMELLDILTIDELLAKTGRKKITHAHMMAEHKQLITDALSSSDVVLDNPEDKKSDWRFIGRPLEKNVARAAGDLGIDIAKVSVERMGILPFNSKNKFSVAYDASTQEYIVFGAPDILLNRAKLDKDDFVEIESQVAMLSSEGKRLIGIARVKKSEITIADNGVLDPDQLVGLTFMGMLVLYDPVRPEAKEAVEKIVSYGARVVMVTGDLKGTAIAIAQELGWEVTDGNVITGEEVRQLSDEELLPRLDHIKIFARVTPEDKLRIGKLFQSTGEIVAMTGDGVNDAPALKSVDIGIAIGSGSDVAKGVADLVLLDDNFQTIVLSIEEGRRIISNIRKAFVYLMSNSLDEVILIGGSLIVGLPFPLTPLQIIWVNFFTGSLPALSYAFEENRDVGQRKTQVQRAIFDREVRAMTLGLGVLSSLLLFAAYWGMIQFGVALPVARTVLFLAFSSYILIIAFSFKSLHRPIFSYPLFDNRALNISLLFAGAMVIASFVLVPFQKLFNIAPIPMIWLLPVIGWLIFNMALVEAVKWFFRRGNRLG